MCKLMDYEGSHGGSDVKESAYNVEDLSLIPELGRFPWRRERLPSPLFWPGEFHGQRSLAGYSPCNSPGQNTGVGSCSLLQGIFPTQGSNPGLPTLQADSLPAEPQGKPRSMWEMLNILFIPWRVMESRRAIL